MNNSPSPGNLRRTCVHLSDAERTAIFQIQEITEISSSALIIRIATRELAKRLNDPARLAEPESKKREKEVEQHG